MSKIRLLSDHLANQIAAGEVVERPASVVKELVENSLDAVATRISIQVEGSGSRLVRVVDNGEGMDEDDVLLSLERHATSKLHEESRLDAINSLGFRGEALPSIGSVSRLILLSRQAERETGTRAEIRYGRLHGVHEAGCAQGTVVEVRNLFGNVPVRKKFMKTPRTELFHIEEVVRNQSLAHVRTAFSLAVDGRPVLDLPARKSLQERFCDVFKCREYWLQVESGFPDSDIQVHGFLQQPGPSSARGSRLRILVNGRPIQDRMVRHAIIDGLQGFLMKGQSPGGALLLDISPDQVDVNVHPAKHEVRFRQPSEVHRAIVAAVRESVRQYQDKVRSDVFAVPETNPGPKSRPKTEPGAAAKKTTAPALFTRSGMVPVRSAEKSAEYKTPDVARYPGSERILQEEDVAADENTAPGEDFSGLHLVGQLFDLYLLCEKDGQLVVIDQHAAHERILYEELRKKYLQHDIPHQSLMFPVSVELATAQAEIMESRSGDVARLGFRAEHFGDETWVIKAVPAPVSHVDAAELLLDTLEGLRSVTPGELPGEVTPSVEALLSSMACKAAVKAGHRLDPQEILELLASMQGTDYFSHCPHGRPVIKIFTKREIEQWFKRV